MIELMLYKNSSPVNATVKEKTLQGTYLGTLREPCDMLNPVITLNNEGEFANSSINHCNYFWIPVFNRWYFVVGKVAFVNGLYTIAGHVDALSTYWDEIKKCDCIVSRNEFKRTKDLVDPELWCTADSLYGFKKFPNSPLTQQVGLNYLIMLQGAG